MRELRSLTAKQVYWRVFTWVNWLVYRKVGIGFAMLVESVVV